MHRRNTQQTHGALGSFKRRSIKLRPKDVKDVDECEFYVLLINICTSEFIRDDVSNTRRNLLVLVKQYMNNPQIN